MFSRVPGTYFYPNSELKIEHCHNWNSCQKEKNTVNLMPRKPKYLLSKISKVDIKGTTIIL